MARDLKHKSLVAIKVLAEEFSLIVRTERFVGEIETAARLTHPHIVKPLDSGSAVGLLYYVMPYIDGGTLASRIEREGRLRVEDAVAIAREVADALGYAHGEGVIHRDIKPGNILLAAGHAWVTDFGIAKAMGADNRGMTGTGARLGTADYMSPEQVTGAPLDGRSDIYSLGCVLFEMLAGAPPFDGPNIESVLARRVVDPAPPIRSLRPDVPEWLERVLRVTLETRPVDRFGTAEELAEALANQRTRTSGAARRLWSRLREHIRRRRTLAAVAALGVAGTGIVLVLLQGSNAMRFRERDWVLVADFNGPPDDPSLADAVRELATTELNQSRFVSTLPRQQLNSALRLAGRPDTTHVAPEIARELAYRSSVRAVMVGGISRLGRGNYSIVLQVIDAEAGTDIASAAGAATDSTLVATVQRMGRQVREGLGERRAIIQANLPLDQVATPSFEAFRRYLQGVKLQDKGDGFGSNRVLREALALDTGFASAWLVIGWNYLNDRMLDSARAAFAEAVKRPDRLGVPRRYRAEADAAYAMRYDLTGAVRAYDLYLEHFTRSYSVLNNRGNYLLALGRYEEALQDFREGVAVHPFGRAQAQVQLANEAATLIALGRIPEARAEARDLTGPFATYVRIMLAVATDDWVGADTVASSAATSPSAPNWLRVQAVATEAAVHAARGQIADADRVLNEASRGAAPDVGRWYGRARLLLAEASGLQVPMLTGSTKRDTSPAGLVTYGLWAAQAGDTAAARVGLHRINQLPDVDRARLGFGPAMLQARLAAASGRWEDVLRAIGPAALSGEHDTALLDRVNSLALRWLAARAYAQLGRADSAIAMLELVLRPTRMPGNAFALRGVTFPFAHRWLARLHAQRGSSQEARQHWSAFLSALTRPDSILVPAVAEAWVEFRRLGGSE